VGTRQKQDYSPSSSLDESPSTPNKLIRRATPLFPPAPVRMVTRGVSGAVRPKSVDEILSNLDVSDHWFTSI
jgi:chromatin modification-related protein VID21